MEEKSSRKSILWMQQRNKRAKIRPCVCSTRARGRKMVKASCETLAQGFGQSVAATMGHGQQKPKQNAKFPFALSFAFLLFPFSFLSGCSFLSRHPENNFFSLS
jgi:hypothetical protein